MTGGASAVLPAAPGFGRRARPEKSDGIGAGIPCLGGKTRRGLLYAKIMTLPGDDSILSIMIRDDLGEVVRATRHVPQADRLIAGSPGRCSFS